MWKEVGLNLPNLKQPMKDFIDVVWMLKLKDGVLDWVLFAITAWVVWNNRNAFKHERRCKDPKRIAMSAREYAKEVAGESLPPSQGPAPARTKWCPP